MNSKLVSGAVIYRFGDCALDPARRGLRRRGCPTAIEPKPFDVLAYLIENRHRVVGRDELINHMWPGRVVTDSSLSTCIKQARRAIGDDGISQRWIRTTPRRGFRFIGAVGPDDATGAGTETPAVEAGESSALGLGVPSVAVLPFTQLSGGSRGKRELCEHLADGMAEDMISALSKFRWLRVVARGSSFAFRGRTVDVRQISRELGARYVLDGSVRVSGRRLRVSVRLVEAKGGSHLWTERFDREIEDVFAIQDEITGAVVRTIAPYIDERERQLVRRRAPSSLDAWSLYQEGLAAYHTQTEAGLRVAAKAFDCAAAVDPEFAIALGYAAASRNRIVLNFSPPDRDALLAEARDRVTTALALDPWDAVAVLAYGVLASLEGDPDLATRRVREALALNPNAAYTWAILSYVERNAGRFEEALRASDRAIELSPKDPAMPMLLFNRTSSLFALRRYDECVECGRLAVQGSAPFAVSYLVLAAALVHLGHGSEAVQVLEELEQRFPGYASSPPRGMEPAMRVLRRAGLEHGIQAESRGGR
jgi:adenylate cyclase